MSDWSALRVPKPPQELEGVVGTLSSVSEALIAAMRIVKTSIQALAALEVMQLSVTQLAIDAAVREIEKAIEALLQDTGVYALHVPVRKKIVVSPLIQEALARTGTGQLPQRMAHRGFLQEQAAMLETGSPELIAFLNGVVSADGGNAGFARTVIESLHDEGDHHRPQLGPSTYVGGYHIMAGAPDYLSLLSFLTLFSGLKFPGLELAVTGEPIPSNLRAKLVAGGDGSARLAARLEWSFQPPVVQIPGLGMTAQVTRVCIVRAESPAFLSVRSVQEVFETTPLSKGLRRGDVEVVDVLDYAKLDLKSTYLDEGLEKNKTYYYAVGFDYTGGTPEELVAGAGKAAGFRALSNVVKVHCEDPLPRNARGIPPDWVRTPAAIDLFPDVAYFARWASSLLSQFGDFTSGYAEILRSMVRHLEQQTTAYATMVEDAARIINRLSALGGFGNIGNAHMRGFQGQGGNAFFVQDMLRALSPSNPDPLRPPYDQGDELVTGFVIVAAAPTLAALKSVMSVLSLFFGAPGAQEKNIIRDALDKLGEVFDDEEFGVSPATPPSPPRPMIGDTPGACPPEPPDQQISFGPDFSIQPRF